jgi:hypothetical protein
VHGLRDEPFLLGSEPLHWGAIREVTIQDTRQTKSGDLFSNLFEAPAAPSKNPPQAAVRE